VGFQFGIGREFAIDRNYGLTLFARGRIAKLTNFRGILTESNNGNTGTFGLAKFADGTMDYDNVTNIGSGGEGYATVDFTGFDVGISLNFYSL
jgi:hypothetical protein